MRIDSARQSLGAHEVPKCGVTRVVKYEIILDQELLRVMPLSCLNFPS